MFGLSKTELIKNLEIIRRYLCCYISGEVCDCKFDPKFKKGTSGLSENTGCPELRQTIAMLKNMEDSDFHMLTEKSNIMLTG